MPKNLKADCKNPTPNVTHDTSVNTLRTCSIFSPLLNAIFVPHTAETKILRHGFTQKCHKNFYLMPFTVIAEVKMIISQYNMSHNVPPTRATIYRDGIFEKPIYNLCNAEEQMLHHLLIISVSVVHPDDKVFHRFLWRKNQDDLSTVY